MSGEEVARRVNVELDQGRIWTWQQVNAVCLTLFLFVFFFCFPLHGSVFFPRRYSRVVITTVRNMRRTAPRIALTVNVDDGEIRLTWDEYVNIEEAEVEKKLLS